MSNGRIALTKAGIHITKYYASEINAKSIFVSQKNYPDTIQLGDIRNLKATGLGADVVIGGSPCQNLSITVINNLKHNQGLQGEKSSLFYEYVRVLLESKPTYFLFENVESMAQIDKDIITDFLEVEPIMINSSLFSAQDRKRLYWTNIPVKPLPESNGLLLKH